MRVERVSACTLSDSNGDEGIAAYRNLLSSSLISGPSCSLSALLFYATTIFHSNYAYKLIKHQTHGKRIKKKWEIRAPKSSRLMSTHASMYLCGTCMWAFASWQTGTVSEGRRRGSFHDPNSVWVSALPAQLTFGCQSPSSPATMEGRQETIFQGILLCEFCTELLPRKTLRGKPNKARIAIPHKPLAEHQLPRIDQRPCFFLS